MAISLLVIFLGGKLPKLASPWQKVCLVTSTHTLFYCEGKPPRARGFQGLELGNLR